MRYIGNKESIVEKIRNLLVEKKILNKKLVFFDAFCGTGSVSNFIKGDFDKVIINDNLKWATVYSKGKLVANKCNFSELGFDPFEYLNNNVTVKSGFFYKNYSTAESKRMYFTEDNAGKIDYFRMTIEDWFNCDRINENEYTYLLACLIESVSKVANVAGVYGAFLKHWDSRALKPINFIKVEVNEKKVKSVEVHNNKLEDIIQNIDCDILYMDPPYTQNQYGTQYHLLETLILNDNPSISKVTGSRSTSPMRSDWSKNYKSHILFDYVLANTKAKYIIFSYNNNGFLSKKFIEASLKRYGKAETYTCKKIPYKKYQNWKSKDADTHFEYLFFIELKAKKKVRFQSPLNYIGNKYKIVDDIMLNSPKNVTTMIDAFGGGFNVGINAHNKNVVYNDINFFVKDLIESFYQNDTYEYILYINRTIKKFGLEKGNKESYIKARDYYNSQSIDKRDPRLLFTLILYGFQQQIRFNNSLEFNNPVGIRWFNDKILEKMISFSREIKTKRVTFLSDDYQSLNKIIDDDTFVYLDPPYMLTTGSYNDGKRGFKGWDLTLEKNMFSFLNLLTSRNKKFMLSYVVEHKGKINVNLMNWVKLNNYKIIELGDVMGISGSRRKEVIIINYEL